MPYIKNHGNKNKTIDIDLVKVFAKPLVKYVIFKNRYKSLHLDGWILSDSAVFGNSLLTRKYSL